MWAEVRLRRFARSTNHDSRYNGPSKGAILRVARFGSQRCHSPELCGLVNSSACGAAIHVANSMVATDDDNHSSMHK